MFSQIPVNSKLPRDIPCKTNSHNEKITLGIYKIYVTIFMSRRNKLSCITEQAHENYAPRHDTKKMARDSRKKI